MRKDNVLNTGMSSAVQRRAEARLESQKRKRDDERAQLTPGAEILLDWIDKDLATVGNLQNMVIGINFDDLRTMLPLAQRLNVDDKDLLVAQVLAQAMHIEWLKSTKNRLKVTLRKAKNADKQAEKVENAKLPEAWQEAAKEPS